MSKKIPVIGDNIYLPTIGNGEYFVGGLAKVIGVLEFNNEYHHVLVEEHEGVNYRWEGGIEQMQESLKKRFGIKRAYSTGIIPPCPLVQEGSN